MFHVIANMNLIISHMLHYCRVLLVLSWRKTKNNSRTGRERERERERWYRFRAAQAQRTYLSLHPFLGRSRIGCSHREVDPLDVRLHPQYLLHEDCSNTNQVSTMHAGFSRKKEKENCEASDMHTLSKEACRAGDEDAPVLEVPCDPAAVRHRAREERENREGEKLKETSGEALFARSLSV
jgi:hypothetical protein